ncbi:MAG: hypothetical protein L3J69_05755 [Desulfobacula sp.]|nr:hypothetical protein [Desulfobacula sp.]
MKFQTKILLVTLSILILTLVMNSVLSLASFEKVYVKSQISTYELICKDLKRKIERSLRFGKPLEKFKNMDKLLQDTLEQNPDISTIAICDLKGKVLYHTDDDQIGSNIGSMLPLLNGKTSVKTILKDHYYHSFISVTDRSQKQVGVIKLAFSRQIIFDKLKSMANKNFNMLWILMLLTSIFLVFLLAMVIMRPINAQLLDMREILKWNDKPPTLPPTGDTAQARKSRSPYNHYLKEGVPDTLDEEIISNYLQLSTVKNEIDRLGISIEAFVNSTANSTDKLDTLYHHQNHFVSACNALKKAHIEFKKSAGSELEHLSEDERHRLEQMFLSLDHIITLTQAAGQATDLIIDFENDQGNDQIKVLGRDDL